MLQCIPLRFAGESEVRDKDGINRESHHEDTKARGKPTKSVTVSLDAPMDVGSFPIESTIEVKNRICFSSCLRGEIISVNRESE
jgi:hypothetical protein